MKGCRQAGCTKSVYRQSSNLNGHTRKQRRKACNIPAIFSGLIRVTGNDILKCLLRKVILFDYRSNDLSKKIVWSDRRRAPAWRPKGVLMPS